MELLLNGKFNEEDRKELETVLTEKNVKVYEYLTKGFEHGEVVRFLFRDLDAFNLIRDGILFSTMQWLVGKSINWAKKKKPRADIKIGADLRVKNKDKTNSINIDLPTEDDLIWEEFEKSVNTKFVESLEGEEIVNVSWDNTEKKVKIKRLKL